MPLYCGKKNAGFKPVGNLTENNGVYSGFYAGSDFGVERLSAGCAGIAEQNFFF